MVLISPPWNGTGPGLEFARLGEPPFLQIYAAWRLDVPTPPARSPVTLALGREGDRSRGWAHPPPRRVPRWPAWVSVVSFPLQPECCGRQEA